MQLRRVPFFSITETVVEHILEVDFFYGQSKAGPWRTSTAQKPVKSFVVGELEGGKQTTSAFHKGSSANEAKGKQRRFVIKIIDDLVENLRREH